MGVGASGTQDLEIARADIYEKSYAKLKLPKD
jgi:hypothetical protein